MERGEAPDEEVYSSLGEKMGAWGGYVGMGDKSGGEVRERKFGKSSGTKSNFVAWAKLSYFIHNMHVHVEISFSVFPSFPSLFKLFLMADRSFTFPKFSPSSFFKT